jgi:hypothetical protein
MRGCSYESDEEDSFAVTEIVVETVVKTVETLE